MAEKTTGFEVIEKASTKLTPFQLTLPRLPRYTCSKSMNPLDEFEWTATLENSCNSQTLRALRHSSLLRM